MRARNIKPGFFKNADLVECSIAARLLAPGLWLMADKEGRLEDRPKQIKIEVFPCDNLDINELLNELASNQHIKRYEVNGKRFIQICKFKEHQRPHNNEAESEIPSENGEYSTPKRKIVSTLVESASDKDKSTSSLTTDSLTTDSLNPFPEKKEISLTAIVVPKKQNRKKTETSPEFEEFWIAWEPYEMSKGSKADAQKKYNEAREDIDHATIIGKAREYNAECKRTRCKTKHVAVWLNKRGWEGEYDATGTGNIGNTQPDGQKVRSGSFDNRDPASRAHDEAQRIIAKRQSCREAEQFLIAEERSRLAGPANPAALANLCKPEHLRGQSPDDGIPRPDVPNSAGELSIPAH